MLYFCRRTPKPSRPQKYFFETDIISPLRWWDGNYPLYHVRRWYGVHTYGGLFYHNSYTMYSNKNYSPAPTKNERTITRNKIIARVMRGERFRLRTDRMGFTYRFEREDDIHFTFYINNLLVGATTQGAFQDMGFALSLRVLGEPTVFTVLRDDIRFIDEPATLPFLTISRKGGAVC